MSELPVDYRVAQAVGLAGSAWLAGNIASYSLSVVPSLSQHHKDGQLSTSQATKLWATLYNHGKTQNPPISVLTASGYLYLAWSVRSGSSLYQLVSPNASALYSTAAIIVMSIVPFTLIGMISTNNALHEKANTAPDAMSGENPAVEVQGLLQSWTSLNAVRSLLPLAATLVGIFASVG
ncbi:hypothetical protein BGW36DRAFT_360994 [Talaromyces proteolyticus]|uniref:DUF1772-domain-containing protein n=1 Tax=Talaromyces proteolyticus TaxID=1131652 RepID=A0AAD4PUN4_9EURO|nr:uncharacterized protein BGW36DRAFT_360994 [Talaromyces proteolyticus]KAH8695291.1 hypothetical protein BGW36DRAFT_360994 [Talaromyces proteolyticus]